MSLGKGIAKLAAATLFTLLLSFFVVALSLQNMTSHAVLSSMAKGVFRQQADAITPAVDAACASASSVDFEVMGEKVSVSCDEARNSDAFAERIFDKVYYRNYTCGLLDCLSQPQAFASSFGNKMFADVAFFSLVATVLSGIAMLYLLDKRVRGMGASLVFVGLNYFVILLTKNIVPAGFADIINPLFAPMETYFLYILAAGAVLFAAGAYFKK